MNRVERNNWAAAIALRISNEWGGASDFPEDAEMLRSFLERSLRQSEGSIERFVGTGIIESDYFEKLT